MDMPKMSDCERQMVQQRREEAPMPIKICDCDCDCDCECCIERLYSSLQLDPERLQKLDKIQFAHTPLHDAAAEGNTTLALEIMNLMPSLGKKLNLQGLSPLHVAVRSGQAHTALALAKLDKRLVCIKGKGGQTPLHLAAASASSDHELRFLADLLVECPEAMSVLNNRLQSPLHVALENNNEEVGRLLVNWLVIMAKESELSIKDSHGNTTLHVAARYCRSPVVLKSLSKLVEINKANYNEETPLDVAKYQQNMEAVKVLELWGAKTLTPRKKEEISPTPLRMSKQSTMVRYLTGHYADQWTETLTRSYYFLTKELTMEMRNTILVVAVLIATTTYQGVLQPPGGVYSAEGNTTTTRLGRPFPMRRQLGDHPPGKMVMGTTKYSYFMPTNTLAFMSSTLMIIYVLPDRAFIMILQACLIFMCISYLLALNFISYYNNVSKILDIVCGVILGMAFWSKLAYYTVKAYYEDEQWLMRRLGVTIKNYKAWLFRKDISAHKDDDHQKELSLFRRMRQQYKLISKRLD